MVQIAIGIPYGADVGIRTPEYSLKHYTISNRAPSASSDTSPNRVDISLFVIFGKRFVAGAGQSDDPW